VHREITALWGKNKVVLHQTPRAVTPFGGLIVFIKFLQKIGYGQQVSQHPPVHLKSPNAIDPAQTFPAFLISVVAGRDGLRTPRGCGRMGACTFCWG
jgi:hypothetical protein